VQWEGKVSPGLMRVLITRDDYTQNISDYQKKEMI